MKKSAKNQSSLERILIKAGFSDRQIQIYLALLRLGRATVAQIMREVGMNRTTGYSVLDSLIAKGLVVMSGKEPKQEYIAESPDRLAEFLNEEAKKAQARADAAKQIIPELKSIYNVADKPKVMFYEGEEGLERVYEDSLTSHETIRAYANIDDLGKALPRYFKTYFKRRAAKGIHIRGIVPGNAAGLEHAKRDKDELREMALVPADKYYFSPEINIYDDKIMIVSWKENLGIIIQSKEIADAMKTGFELAWAEAKRIDVRRTAE